MVDTAARLTDAVLPAVPVRQWVLSLPIEIRYRLAYDGPLQNLSLPLPGRFLRINECIRDNDLFNERLKGSLFFVDFAGALKNTHTA